MGLVTVALRKIRQEGLLPTAVSAASDPAETIYVSDTFRTLTRLYCRYRPIRSRGITIDASDERVRREAHKIVMGRYEDEIVEFVERYVPPGVDVVELGGGIGYVSATVDRHVDGGTQVVVEPNPAILPILKRTRELNDAGFEIVERAYESNGNDVELSAGAQFITASTVRSHRDSSRVPGVSLRRVVDEFGLEEFVLIVDIEGAEVDLVDAELDLVLESCPYLVVEYHCFEDVERDVRAAKAAIEGSELVPLERRADENTEKVIYRNPRLSSP